MRRACGTACSLDAALALHTSQRLKLEQQRPMDVEQRLEGGAAAPAPSSLPDNVFLNKIVTRVAQNGYATEIAPAMGLCKDTWAINRELWGWVVDAPIGARQRTRLMYRSGK